MSALSKFFLFAVSAASGAAVSWVISVREYNKRLRIYNEDVRIKYTEKIISMKEENDKLRHMLLVNGVNPDVVLANSIDTEEPEEQQIQMIPIAIPVTNEQGIKTSGKGGALPSNIINKKQPRRDEKQVLKNNVMDASKLAGIAENAGYAPRSKVARSQARATVVSGTELEDLQQDSSVEEFYATIVETENGQAQGMNVYRSVNDEQCNPAAAFTPQGANSLYNAVCEANAYDYIKVAVPKGNNTVEISLVQKIE